MIITKRILLIIASLLLVFSLITIPIIIWLMISTWNEEYLKWLLVAILISMASINTCDVLLKEKD